MIKSRIPSFHALRKAQDTQVVSPESVFEIINAISVMVSFQTRYFEMSLKGAHLILYIVHPVLQSRGALPHFLHIMAHDSDILPKIVKLNRLGSLCVITVLHSHKHMLECRLLCVAR